MILDRIKALPLRARILLAVSGGMVMAMAMPPFGVWPLFFPGFFALYAALSTINPLGGLRSFAIGWAFGFGYFLFGLYWIGNALLVPGNDFVWAWPFAVLGLPVGLAIFTGAGICLATRLANLKTWRGYAALVTGLIVADLARGYLLTGFPWNLYGYGWAGLLPIVQSVAAIGIYGLTALTIAWGLLPAFLYIARPARHTGIIAVCLAVFVFAGLYAWGGLRLHHNPTRDRDDVIVRIVQPNIPQEEKWNRHYLVQNLERLAGASSAGFRTGKTYAIIWPETAITDYTIQDENAASFIRDTALKNNPDAYLLSGVLRHEINAHGKPEYFNSLVTYDSSLSPVAVYDKSHLVPFGEYIPFQKFIPLTPVVQFSGFTPGVGPGTQTVPALPGFSSLVCYEVVFPGRVTAPQSRPQWMVNVTNDGWYGDSPGPYQHLTKSIFRAVEEGIPLARSANTGISALIDPYGRVLGKIPYGQGGYIDLPLPQSAEIPDIYVSIRRFFTPGLVFILMGITLIRGQKPETD